VLRAPLGRVWSAISDTKQFGAWFGVDFDGPFVAGGRLTGRIVPTTVDPDIAKMQEPYRGIEFDVLVDRVEPMHLLSFRWHPGEADPAMDYTAEPRTLVTFELEADGEGTRLTITESGFDALPLARRAEAFASNDGGWAAQLTLVDKYLTRNA
jgi:uncharacterized protein YndB with AHSA1/START domain